MGAPLARHSTSTPLPRSSVATTSRAAQFASAVAAPADDTWWLESVDDGERDSWMLSYLDILTLLLTLFVVIIAITHAELQKRATAPSTSTSALEVVTTSKDEAKKPAATPQNSVAIGFNTGADKTAPTRAVADAPAVVEDEAALVTTMVVQPNGAIAGTPLAVPTPSAETMAAPASIAGDAKTANETPFTDHGTATRDTATQDRAAADSTSTNTVDQVDATEHYQTSQDRASDDKHSLASLGETGWMQVEVGKRGVMIELGEDVLFTSASAALATHSVPALDALANVLADMPYVVWIEGHTDTSPIATAAYPSNWELSTARATAVTRYMIERGIPPQRLRAVGYGDTQPRTSNDTEDGRTHNRRVVFRVEMPSDIP